MIVGTFVAVIALATVVFFAVSASDTFNLQCALASPSSGSQRYAFHIEIPKFLGKPRVVWVGINTHDLMIVRSDDTVIIVELDQRLSGWPDKADLMQFQFHRITGDAEMYYLQKPTETDRWPAWLVLEDFSKKGTCSKSERAF